MLPSDALPTTEDSGTLRFVDSHAHLDLLCGSAWEQNEATEYQGRIEHILSQARVVGVHKVLSVATTLEGAQRLADRLAPFANQVVLSCGLHPSYVTHPEPDVGLAALAKRPEFVALGETGLDFSRGELASLRSAQQSNFLYHLEIAHQVDKPVIVHTRAALSETLHCLKTMMHRGSVKGVIHCFTEEVEAAFAFLDLGFYLSFSGILTFKNSPKLREVASKVPLNRVLIETDSPYLAPVPYRGKENCPAFIPAVAACLAQVQGCSLKQVANTTCQNFEDLFRVPA